MKKLRERVRNWRQDRQHDLNNLLTGVLGNASLLQEDLDPNHPAQARVREIIQASERAAILVKQMLAYAGKGPVLTRGEAWFTADRESLERTLSHATIREQCFVVKYGSKKRAEPVIKETRKRTRRDVAGYPRLERP